MRRLEAAFSLHLFARREPFQRQTAGLDNTARSALECGRVSCRFPKVIASATLPGPRKKSGIWRYRSPRRRGAAAPLKVLRAFFLEGENLRGYFFVSTYNNVTQQLVD